MTTRILRSMALAFGLALALSPLAFGQPSTQTPTAPTNASSARNVASGEKMKIKGIVVRRDADTFVVRDLNNVDTTVRLTDQTSVKTHASSFLSSGHKYPQTNILRGLNLEVQGRGGSSGELVAEKITFDETDLRAAVSNAARGGAKAAQETADAAVAGVNATNDRISALDDYVPQDSIAVNFRVGSSVLNPDANTKLDAIATKPMNAKGYVLEVTGFADSTGNTARNRALSQRRADAVISYLVENHQIPLRRIVTPYGFGESNPIADNKTREGRAENRRVEVKVLVNKGLTQPGPTMKSGDGSGQ